VNSINDVVENTIRDVFLGHFIASQSIQLSLGFKIFREIQSTALGRADSLNDAKRDQGRNHMATEKLTRAFYRDGDGVNAF